MRKHTKFLLIAVIASLITAPALLAHDSRESSGSGTDHGMMGRDGMMGGGMMGSMMQMMEHCGQMMRGMPDGTGRPNDQWKKAPSAPGERS